MNKLILEAAKKFGDLKKQYEKLETELKTIGEDWDDVEKELIELMVEEGVASVTIEGYGKFSVQKQTYPSVNASNKPFFYEYLQESGHGSLLKLDVNPQTLNSFLKRHQEELKKQFMEVGLTVAQRDFLAQLPEAEQRDAHKISGIPVDEMEADALAVDLLKSRGASMFSKVKIRTS